MNFNSSAEFAKEQDQNDPLRSFRSQFHIPQHKGQDTVYFTGNSLGLQPKSTKKYIEEELSDWAEHGVEGHFDVSKRPWFHYHKFSKKALANLFGAKELEVVSMNNLTGNLHLMMVSFFRPEGKRNKIMIESGAFPSDYYAVESQLRFHGLNPEEHQIELKPRSGEYTLRTEDIIASIEKHADELALVMFPGVQYYTGQYFDLEKITKAAHSGGAKAGFDLAHAAGNLPMKLHDWNVDFAVWCSYKYLNSGPGGISGIFVHEKHAENKDLPRFAGWWGYNEEKRFQMKPGFDPMTGADGWQLSNVNVLTSAAHLASLEIFEAAGIENLRKKSLHLTAYTEYLLEDINSGLSEKQIDIITPKDPNQRGAQLSLIMKQNGKAIFDYLSKEGVIADWREPDVIRIAPAPLYNSYDDSFKFYSILKKYYNIGN
ncbi:kynureninase [Hyphobacterium sp. CCMP332]|nr:kynureninase [Hyphobacterium sp. CCMP332]